MTATRLAKAQPSMISRRLASTSLGKSKQLLQIARLDLQTTEIAGVLGALRVP
jgi:hypothetical protein